MTSGAKSAVVTGAAAGIGAATVHLLCARGWSVVAVDTAAPNEKLFAGLPVSYIAGDVTNPATHEYAAVQANEIGGLSGWVNNAAVQIDGAAADLDERAVHRQFDVNVRGMTLGCAAALRHFSGRGAIVSMSSIHALRGFPRSFAYAGTKAAIVAMSRQLAVEYGPVGIRSNVVLPGAIHTAMCERDWASAADPAAARRADERMHLEDRMGRPEEIAEIVEFLLSERSSLINGQAIVADGGATARHP